MLARAARPGGRRIDGADAIVAHLAGRAPGEVARLGRAGVAAPASRSASSGPGAGATDRRRWYVRTGAGRPRRRAVEHGRAPDRPGACRRSAPPQALLGELGATRVAPLSHGGNSGAALLRAYRDDGTAFVLKRVSAAGADWLARATRDDGRTAQLYAAGAFDRDAVGDRPRHRRRRAHGRRRLDRDARRPGATAAAGRPPVARRRAGASSPRPPQLHRGVPRPRARRCRGPERPDRDVLARRGRRGAAVPRPPAEAVRAGLGRVRASSSPPTSPTPCST